MQDILEYFKSLMSNASLEEREAYDAFLQSCLQVAMKGIPAYADSQAEKKNSSDFEKGGEQS